MPQITVILALILVGVLAIFGAQNTEAVTLHILWFTAHKVPLSLTILGGAVIGAVLSFFVILQLIPGGWSHVVDVAAIVWAPATFVNV